MEAKGTYGSDFSLKWVVKIIKSDQDSAVILSPINFDSFNFVLSSRDPR